MVSEDKAADIKKERSDSITNSETDDVHNKHEAVDTKEDIIRLDNKIGEEKDINSKGKEEEKTDVSKKLDDNEVEPSDNKQSRQNENETSNADEEVVITETNNEERKGVPVNTLINDDEINSEKPLINLPDLEVPFSERRLTPETINLLNKPVDRKLTISGIEFQFSKLIGIILKSKGLDYSDDFLSQMSDLSITYFHDIIETLKKFTEIQRRKKPSISDTELCFRMKGIKPDKLYKEYEETNQIAKKYKSEIGLVNKQTTELIKEFKEENKFDENDPSLLFFTNEHYEITELIPKQSSKPIYIPYYLPDLPPDYTYQKTPKYMDMITDLKQLRLKLVDESRLTEKSLYNLIDDDEKKWKENFEKQIRDTLLEVDEDVDSENKNSVMSETDQKNQTDIGTPIPDNHLDEKETKPQPAELNTTVENLAEAGNADEALQDKKETQPTHTEGEPRKLLPDVKRFDFVAYAQKRSDLQRKKENEIERKRKLRESNIFFEAEKYYSPYATLPVTHEVDLYFANIVHDEFMSVIRSVRTAEKKKKRKVEKILREKAEREQAKEKEREKMGLGFSFGPISHMLDDDNDDSDKDEDMGFPTFDFGDNNETQDNHPTDMNLNSNSIPENNETELGSTINADINTAAHANSDEEMDSDSFEAELEDAVQVDSAPKNSLLENDIKTSNEIPSESSDDEVELEDV